MANLTEIARVTRVSVKVVGALLVTLVVGRVLLTWSVSMYKAMVPPPPIPPTVGFNKLPRPVFPEDSAGELTYKLETVDGSVPSYGPSAKVYFISKSQTSLLGLDRGKQKAAALGFVFEPEQTSGTLYRWKNTSPMPATLDLDYTTGNFTMKVAWETNPKLLNEKLIPSEVQAIAEAKNYLKQAGALPADMVNGEAVATYLKYSGGKMVKAISLSDADFVEVNLFRQSVDKVKILPADPNVGLGHFIFSGSRGQGERILLAEYKHTQVEYQQFETYPLISGDVAWQKLNGGEGYVAVAPENGDTAVVRRVSIAYYDSLNSESYLQPIYVFEGDDGFMGYVPAVSDMWLQ